jgi:hypothetical protein
MKLFLNRLFVVFPGRTVILQKSGPFPDQIEGGYPVRREWLLTGVDFVRSLNISDNEKSLILGENAVRMFNIKL